MERRKFVQRENIRNTEAGKLMATWRNICKYFPNLTIEENFDYQEYFIEPDLANYHENLEDEIEEKITSYFNEYFNNLPKDKSRAFQEVKKVIEEIKCDENFTFLHVLKRYFPVEYKPFLNSYFQGMPTVLAQPSPFFQSNPKAGKTIQLKQAIVKEYGYTTMEISGLALFGEDIKTTLSLLKLMQNKPFENIKGDFICFQTTLVEIAKTMQNKHPYHICSKDNIWSSLQRLRGCVITWKREGKPEIVGGIISKAKRLEKNDGDGITIYLDSTFVEMFSKGYVNMNPQIVYSLPDKQLMLYFYLQSQKTFNKYDKWEGSLFHLYQTALRGIPEKPIFKIRFEMKQLLNDMKKTGIICSYTISKDDKIIISKTKQLKTENRTIEPKNRPAMKRRNPSKMENRPIMTRKNSPSKMENRPMIVLDRLPDGVTLADIM